MKNLFENYVESLEPQERCIPQQLSLLVDDNAIERRALELWREREMGLAPRVRRMSPDALDKASGAWASCIVRAIIEREIPVHMHDT
jgi:hypothetical protein